MRDDTFGEHCSPYAFWSPPAVVNTTDFTPCFEDTVILWSACGFLWLFSALNFLLQPDKTESFIVLSHLHRLKLIAALLVVVGAAVQLGDDIARRHDVPDFFWTSSPVLIATVLLAMLVIEYDRRHGVRSSGILFFFWLFLTVYSGVRLRTWILLLQHNDQLNGIETSKLQFGAFCCLAAGSLVSLICSTISDRRPLYAVDVTVNPCPEEQASFLSLMTFWWLNPLISIGYKRALQRDDLWALNSRDRCGTVSAKFEKSWREQRHGQVGRVEKQSGARMRKKGHISSIQHTSTEYTSLLGNAPDGSPSVDVKEPSLVIALAKAFGGPFLAAALLKIVNDVLTFVNPQILKLLIAFTQAKDQPAWHGYGYAVLMFATAMVQTVFQQQYFHVCFTVGMRVRSAVVATVYRKALVLSNAARRNSTAGEIVNLMSVDAQRFADLSAYFHMIWSAPLQICLALYFLWGTMQEAILAGVAVMILLIPVNALVAAMSRKLQIRQMNAKDSRIKIMNEVLNGIKVIKLYAWERSFLSLVTGIRDKELQVLKESAYLNAASSFTWMMAPFLVALATFATYANTDDHHLTAAKAFVALSLFNILRFPLNMLPMLVAFIVEASVSVKRLTRFLLNNEIDFSSIQRENRPPADGSNVVSIDHGTFSWGPEDAAVLHNIQMSAKENQLIAVVGSVGAGKSSLIAALLGEMEKRSGHVNMKGHVAYVPQQAWIQNATVRDNISFGKHFNQQVYTKVVNACALGPDLEMLPGGDTTEIGEKGINLSGGQKQRVSLARAVYANADIYLLDDPLSAVDSHVGKHIFENVIGPNGILKHKVRVFVTNHVGLLAQCDNVLVLQNGKISESGTYNDLLEQDGAFADFLRNYGQTDDSDEGEDEEEEEEVILGPEDEPSAPDDSTAMAYGEDMESVVRQRVRHEHLERQRSEQITDQEERKRAFPSTSADDRKTPQSMSAPKYKRQDSLQRQRSVTRQASQHMLERQASRRPKLKTQKSSIRFTTESTEPAPRATLIEEEKAETGKVKLAVFTMYMKAIGVCLSFFILCLYIMNNACSIGTNIWLAHWSSESAIAVSHNDSVNVAMYLGVYGALGCAQGLFVLAGSIVMAMAAVGASRQLHHDMLRNILRSPMSFFDTTPLGRVVNRFSKDVYTIDETIPRSLRSFAMTIFNVVSILVVISYSTPIFLSMILPLGLIYFFTQRYYVATSRQLKRLESVSRSPIYSHFSETLSGVSTIRAYGCQERFILESDHRVDSNQQAYYPNISANRWLALRLELVGNSIVFFAALFAVLEREYGFSGHSKSTQAALVGLSISYALMITQTLNWMVRMTSELETNIVSVERVKEYSETPTEADAIVQDNRPSGRWPFKGHVSFSGYKTRYRPGLDLVIKGIKCDIEGGEKVGIVGRTGAGKSSLTLALFRIIEPAGGSITIDGMDISRMGLEDLRSRLTIIPQDPVLFSGTLRFNLDPFDEHTDQEVWNSLEHSHLKQFVSGLDEGLMFEVAEGGENLSVGQRQLVCLGRALLRKTKILVLDEATAAVDLETDDLIQRTIRTEFAGCTVLTIAHRLNTIMDYDKVMVLDSGLMIEYDSPDQLLSKKGHFYSMAQDAGIVS